MKYIRKFNEYDTNAGSLYAYVNPEVRKYPDSFDLPTRQTELYTCADCGVDYYCFKENEPACPVCKSNIYI